MALINQPTITDSVNQSFFIEALGGSQHPISYLDRFPDTVYTKAIDSLLVKFLYALLGPVGVGALRQEYLEARLQAEMAGLSTVDLDALYTNAFAFARLADETYLLDADAALLPASQRSQILAQDASFRNRAIDFLKGARAGGTLLGITLAARSGLNRPVEVIENYRALYDRYTDVGLNLPYFGNTNSITEAIVVPRQVSPQSAVQTLTISGEPVRGWFSMSYPAGQNWYPAIVATTAGSATVTVTFVPSAGFTAAVAPSGPLIPAGAFVTLTNLPSTATNTDPTVAGWNNASLYAISGGGSGTSISLIYPPSAGALAGQPAPAPSTGNFVALVSNAQSYLIPYNATAGIVQDALTAIPLIGAGNVVVSGGPLPDQPIQIQFANALSDQSVPTLATNAAPDKVVGLTSTGSGGTEQMSDILNNPLNIVATIATTTAGIGIDEQMTTIAPADEYAMRLAVDQIRPWTTIVTTQDAAPETVRQEITSAFSASSQVEVLRYVTGRASVNWPSPDATHWIEGGVEHEAPRALGTGTQHYQGFHNVNSIIAYTEVALTDPTYGTETASLVAPYWNSLIGNFSLAQQTLLPGLQALNDPTAQYLASNAINPQPEPLVITNDTGQPVINGVYPTDYYSLPGIQAPIKVSMWASTERTEGTDYLEIDLGSPQAVNYLYFEASRTPYLIDVAYDTLDQAPARTFRPVTIVPTAYGASTLSLSYDVAATNMWEPVEIFFSNQFGGMIYTRFLRIGFTRAPNGTPFAPIGQPAILYSIEVRNLRAGRNVSGAAVQGGSHLI